MATIVYGVAGEGRGHAARAIALVEALAPRHRVVLFASGHAYDMLAPLYGRGVRDGVELRSLPPVQFRYRGGKRLSYTRTGLASLPFLVGLSELVASVERQMSTLGPALVLTDFEPVVPRAAARLGLPYVSLDHQHFLVANDLGDLPAPLRRYAAFMAPFVRAFYDGQVDTIVSSFFEAPLKKSRRDVAQVGVLLRPEIARAEPVHGDHVVAYLRRRSSASLLPALAASGREVRVYGFGALESAGRLRFFDIDPRGFVEDLATSDALVTTAGNQLIGEALHLGKPVFAVPEEGNFEQRINAFFLERSGAGIAHDGIHLGSVHLRAFFDRIPELRAAIDRERMNGTPVVLARLAKYLTPKKDAHACADSSPIHARSFAPDVGVRTIPAF